MLVWYSKMILRVSKSVLDMSISIIWDTLTSAGLRGGKFSHCPEHWGLALYSTVYTVDLSITEAVYMAMMEAMKGVIWFQGLLDDLEIDQDLLKINCWERTRSIMQGQSTSVSGSTLFERFLMRVTSSYRRFTQKRIQLKCLPKLFRK